jgi:hypothetical protein
MLQKSNRCVVCEQKLHLDILVVQLGDSWKRWGDERISPRYGKQCVGSYKKWIGAKVGWWVQFEFNLQTIKISNMFCKLHHDIINQFILLKLHCINQTPMFVGLTIEPKHTKYGSTKPLGNLICNTQTNNTPMSSCTTVFFVYKGTYCKPFQLSHKITCKCWLT